MGNISCIFLFFSEYIAVYVWFITIICTVRSSFLSIERAYSEGTNKLSIMALTCHAFELSFKIVPSHILKIMTLRVKLLKTVSSKLLCNFRIAKLLPNS